MGHLGDRSAFCPPPITFFLFATTQCFNTISKKNGQRALVGYSTLCPPPKFILFASTQYFNYNSESWFGIGLYGCRAGGILPSPLPLRIIYLPPLNAFIPIPKISWATGTGGGQGYSPPLLLFSFATTQYFDPYSESWLGKGSLGGGHGALCPSGTKFLAKGKCRPFFIIWGQSRTENSRQGLIFLTEHLFCSIIPLYIHCRGVLGLLLQRSWPTIQVKPSYCCKMAMYVLVGGAESDLHQLNLQQIKPTAHLSCHGRLQVAFVLTHQRQDRSSVTRVENWNTTSNQNEKNISIIFRWPTSSGATSGTRSVCISVSLSVCV